MTSKQELLFGIGWLIVGLGTAVSGQLWIGIALCVFGIFVLAHSRIKRTRR